MNDTAFDFQIDEGIEIPAREIVGRPRGSQYPLERMSVGQSFFLPLNGEEGATRTDREGNVTELTEAEDLDRKMRQKQSYFSQLGKKLGISIKTRTYEDGTEYNARFAGQPGIGVWHGGERVETEEEEEVPTDTVEIGDDE
jgi:hypothetical protein